MVAAKAARPAPAGTSSEPRVIDQAGELIEPTHIRDAKNLQAPIVVVVAPTKRAGYFCATLDGRVIVGASRQPLLDTARHFLADGASPSATIAMTHVGSADIVMSAVISVAALLTVAEGEGCPRIAPNHQVGADHTLPSLSPPPRALPGARHAGTQSAGTKGKKQWI